MTLREIFFADFLWIFKGLQGIAKFCPEDTDNRYSMEDADSRYSMEEHRRPVSTGGHREREERGRVKAASHIWKSYMEEHSRLVLN